MKFFPVSERNEWSVQSFLILAKFFKKPMQKSIILFFVFAAILTTLNACKKDKYLESEALIVNVYGDCGYAIYMDFNVFQPRNLPDSLFIDSLPVIISYKLLDRLPECYGVLPIKDMMHLRTIERKL